VSANPFEPTAGSAEASLPLSAPVPPAVAAQPRAAARAWVDWKIVGIVTLVGLALRLWYALKLHPVGQYIYSDMAGAYHEAQGFADPHHVMNRWDTLKPRGMAFFGGYLLRWFGSHGLTAWGTAQAVLGALTLPLVFIGVRRCFGRRAALVATALLAIDYLAISFTGYLMAETCLMAFLALSFAWLDPRRPWLCLLSGLALGVACIFKAQAAVMLPLWAPVFWWVGRRDIEAGPEGLALGPKRPGSWLSAPRLSALALSAGMIAVTLPESVAISRISHKKAFIATYGGQNVYVGHCHVKLLTCEGGPDGAFDSGCPKVYERNEPWPDVTIQASAMDSAVYVREGLKCYTQSVGYAALWTVEQLADVFAGWPGSTIAPWPDWATGGGGWDLTSNVLLSYVLVPLAFLWFWRHRRSLGAWLGFGLPMVSIWGLAILFSGDPRYREPFDFFILGAAGAWIAARWPPKALPTPAPIENPEPREPPSPTLAETITGGAAEAPPAPAPTGTPTATP